MVERTVYVPRIFGQRGAGRDGGLLRKEKALEEEEEEILENLAEKSTVEVEEKGWKTMLMRGKSIERPVKGNLKNRMGKFKPDGNQVYHYSLKSQSNRQPKNPVNHDVQDNSISSSSQSNWKMRFDQMKENMMSGLGTQSSQI
ncbi:hypothetical protein BY996DRAFT_6410165 [Phakopsora pachyrhizi]|nr:hypothetical protein BY996DRAFT_6410165 [Phakopsora pachyrhizi]